MIGLMKGLQATISHLFTKKVTVQYPEERRELPERSRGLIRTRLLPDSEDPRCIACTFCEQVCPATAIRVEYERRQPEKSWSLDAGAGPMLTSFAPAKSTIELRQWPGNGGAPALGDGCLAGSLLDAGELSSLTLAKTAALSGAWLSQVYGVATFYDQLGPGKVTLASEPDMPEFKGVAGGCPPMLTANLEAIDPGDIETYASGGGYAGVTKALSEMEPAEVADEIAVSGLRGRGGSGYPTGSKWKQALEAASPASRTDSPEKYVICNALEGDPGSFKDRFILENNPHLVIEGMIAAGYAIGAREGIICLGAESARAAEFMEEAIGQAGARGMLGEEIPGTGFSFSVRLVRVPKAFAGGEETALIATLEGERPMPKVRPPYPAQSGLYGRPTLVENVETLALVPWILNNGARAFQKTGAANAPGAKLFTLTGAVKKPGLYEAPLDITIKKLVDGHAGGFSGEPVAALVGSSTGGFLSPGLFDIPLDYDSMAETGGNLSSGAINILSRGDCVVAMARESLAFTCGEACGKCVPGRLGTWRLSDIMERVCSGQGEISDLDLALDLAADTAGGALCFLGRGAVKPLQTAIKFFRNDFEAHITDRKCAAGRCKFS